MNVIVNGSYRRDLNYLLEFLAAWEKRPECLIPIAYQWCSAIAEATGALDWNELTGTEGTLLRSRLKLQDPALGDRLPGLRLDEAMFSKVGHHWGSLRFNNISHRARGRPQDPYGLPPEPYVDLLHTILEIGFRLVTPGHDKPFLNHTSHHTRVFEIAFSSSHDEVVADAVSIWIAGSRRSPPGSCIYYLAKRMQRVTPFSPRLRRVSIHAIEYAWKYPELATPESETVHVLNYLHVDVADMVERGRWVRLLVGVICLPIGLESLSAHYWHLLGELALSTSAHLDHRLLLEVMRMLENAEDWEKLEVWMAVLWSSTFPIKRTFKMEEIEQVTLKLVSQRASALLRFEDLCRRRSARSELRRICDQARAEQLSSESPPPPYVSIRPVQCLSVLMASLSLPQSTDLRPAGHSTPFCGRRHLLKGCIVSIVG
jgi:hypothetical protein